MGCVHAIWSTSGVSSPNKVSRSRPNMASPKTGEFRSTFQLMMISRVTSFTSRVEWLSCMCWAKQGPTLACDQVNRPGIADGPAWFRCTIVASSARLTPRPFRCGDDLGSIISSHCSPLSVVWAFCPFPVNFLALVTHTFLLFLGLIYLWTLF